MKALDIYRDDWEELKILKKESSARLGPASGQTTHTSLLILVSHKTNASQFIHIAQSFYPFLPSLGRKEGEPYHTV